MTKMPKYSDLALFRSRHCNERTNLVFDGDIAALPHPADLVLSSHHPQFLVEIFQASDGLEDSDALVSPSVGRRDRRVGVLVVGRHHGLRAVHPDADGVAGGGWEGREMGGMGADVTLVSSSSFATLYAACCFFRACLPYLVSKSKISFFKTIQQYLNKLTLETYAQIFQAYKIKTSFITVTVKTAFKIKGYS